MSGGALHSSQSSSSAEEGNLTVFHVRAVTHLSLGTVTDCLPRLTDTGFVLVSDSCGSNSLLIQSLASLWSFGRGGGKNAPCNTSHIILVCALGYRKCCALTTLAELIGLWLFSSLLQNTTYVSQMPHAVTGNYLYQK